MAVINWEDVERKYYDLDNIDPINREWSSSSLDPTEGCLSAPAQGDGATNRDGRQMTMLSIHLKGYLFINDDQTRTSPPQDVAVRLLLIRNNQTNQDSLIPQEVMTSIGPIKDFLSFKNLEHDKKYDILIDRTILLKVNAYSTGTSVGQFSVNARMVPFTMNYTFDGGCPVILAAPGEGFSSVSDTSINLIGVSNAENGEPTPYISYTSRLRFIG